MSDADYAVASTLTWLLGHSLLWPLIVRWRRRAKIHMAAHDPKKVWTIGMGAAKAHIAVGGPLSFDAACGQNIVRYPADREVKVCRACLRLRHSVERRR